MAANNNRDDDTTQVRTRLNTSLDVKDLITIVSAAVSITFAWGVFNTRITGLEEKIVAQEAEIRQLKETARVAEARTREHAIYIDQLYRQAFKTTPRHIN